MRPGHGQTLDWKGTKSDTGYAGDIISSDIKNFLKSTCPKSKLPQTDKSVLHSVDKEVFETVGTDRSVYKDETALKATHARLCKQSTNHTTGSVQPS